MSAPLDRICDCRRKYGVRVTLDPDGVKRKRCQACGDVVPK